MRVYFLLIVICVFAVGYYAGYGHRDGQGWDISKDPRACIIEWDDGTYSIKSRIYHVGTIDPGEIITVPENIGLDIVPWDSIDNL